jgi:alpha-tubulin suppressor-like RCC1 family protein
MGPATTPISTGVTEAVAVGVGRRHSCALRSDGTVLCWGANESNQLGDGTTDRSIAPVPVSGIDDASALTVALAGTHACVLRTGGRVSCWGSNLHGQLGDGSTTTRATPVDVGLEGVVAIAAGGHADDGGGSTCAVLEDGAVRCWGEGTLGRLGRVEDADVLEPMAVVGLP